MWSVQPKKTPEDRKHLVALLPSLLKRLSARHAVAGVAAGGARGVHVEPRRGARGGGQAVARARCRRRRPPSPSRRRRRPRSRARPATRSRRAKAEALAAAMVAGRAGRAGARARDPRRRVPRDRARHRARHVGRVRGRGRPARVREARVGEPAARHVPVHQPPGPEGAVDDRRGARRALPRRPRTPGRGRAADRPRVLERADASSASSSARKRPPRDRTSARRRRADHRRRDPHRQARRQAPPHVIATLGARGITLDYAQYLGDDRDRLTAVLRETLARDDVVFSFGGIGATPDDHTRQACAAALGVPLALHPEAVREIEARFGADAYPHRVLMAEFPAGARDHPQSVQPHRRVRGARPPLLPGLPADGVADARLGARDVAARPCARAAGRARGGRARRRREPAAAADGRRDGARTRT